MKKSLSIVMISILMTLSLMGCSSNKTAHQTKTDYDSNKINIVATVFPPYDFAKAVVDGKADLTMLINPGDEIHTFKPTPAVISKIQKADVFIYVGNEDDEWVYEVLGSMDTSKKKIIKFSDYIVPLQQETDEHIWNFPNNAIQLIGVIAKNLCEVDPDNAQEYKQNATSYTSQIQKADNDIKEIVSRSSDKFLVLGDYFPLRYFVSNFGISYQKADCSKQTEAKKSEKGAGPGTLISNLVTVIKSKNIRYVLYVELGNPNMAKEITQLTGAKMVQLYSCHNFTREDFTKDQGITYLTLMQQNAETLQKILS
jgi:zinc transport system substrate-binding protein